MHVIDGLSDVLVGQGEEPADMPLPLPQIKPQRLDEHQMGEMFRHQAAARLCLAQLLSHALEKPAQGRLIRLLVDVDDRRKDAEQNIGVVADQHEAAAGQEEISSAIATGNAATPRGRKDGGGIGRRQGEITRKTEGPPFGQKEAVAALRCTGSETPSMANQHWPERTALHLIPS